MNDKTVVYMVKRLEECQEICDLIKDKNPIWVNVSGLEDDIRRRVVDILTGACYMAGYKMERKESRVYSLSPV